MKIALGMFLLGFPTSPGDWTITSYPSNAIKVKPIAETKPVKPMGIKSAKLDCQLGLFSAMDQNPAIMTEMIATS